MLCIRDVEPDTKNPWNATEVLENINRELKDLLQSKRLRVIIIPDIESINIGRGVGYDVIEHIPPQDIHDISATKIRKQMKIDGKL